tara:strand:+ start:1754 stop:3172 length:1419 start_codon:yes stop_codon:yes gene_type:complete
MLNASHISFLEERGISCETASDAGVYSEGQEICFPTFESGEIINLKYRGPKKRFRQAPDGKQAFYHPEGLDLAIEEGKPLLIVEGELDCLAVLESRYAWVVSIPCGAPAKEVDFYSVEEDNKFKFIWDAMPKLKQVKKFILAGDDDEAGKVLNAELVKRLGAENCKFIQYPDDCKDLNDVLLKYDAAKVNELINTAKDIPVVGLFKPDEFPAIPEEFKVAYSTGYGREHDYHIKIHLGKLFILTGIPGHGKSEWADGLVLNLAQKHNWRVCICSTEINNEEYQENTLKRIYRRPIENVSDAEQGRALDFYNDKFRFITNSTMDDFDLTLEKLIDLATISILRDNCKVLMIDPWNEISHLRDSKNGESETEYIGRAIRQLKKLARQYAILVIIVAHPSKPDERGKSKPPTLYSISGSAHWSNKADFGVTVWREDLSGDRTELIINKIKRHGAMGHTGCIDIKLNKHTSRFEEV